MCRVYVGWYMSICVCLQLLVHLCLLPAIKVRLHGDHCVCVCFFLFWLVPDVYEYVKEEGVAFVVIVEGKRVRVCD